MMAVDIRKRQRKLAKQKAKRKEKKHAIAQISQQGLAGVFKQAANAPIVHACVSDVLWEQGIGNVLLSRELPDRRIAFSMFLVDAYCLGVKDVFWNVLTRLDYEEKFFERATDQFEFTNFSAESVRKLVEGSVDYAARFGLRPHSDYEKARLIFGGIDAGDSHDEFEYGQDGKPFFISGPYDTPERCNRIIAALKEHCGPDGFHYTMHFGGTGIRLVD